MKEWIEENKFIAVLLGIIGGISLLLGYGIFMTFSSNKKTKANITALHTEMSTIKKKYGDANEDTLKNFKIEVKTRINDALALHQNQLKIAHKKINTTKSDSDFAGILKEYVTNTGKKLAGANIKYNTESYFGFNNYKGGSQIVNNPDAIGLALYQQDALTWLIDTIIKHKPEKLSYLYREELREEKDAKPKEYPIKTATRKMPIEIGLIIDEANFSKFLTEVSNSDKYSFTLKHIIIENQLKKPIPYSSLMAQNTAPQPKSTEDSEFTFDTQDEDEFNTEEEKTTEEKIAVPVPEKMDKGSIFIEKIHGGEKLKVSIAYDLVYFYEASKVPIKELNSLK